MESKRVLYVSQEIHPFLPENAISKPSLVLPKKMNEKGHQVRVFMPRYGLINERRHQLHEVIRLSGINIIINDMDQPLIIKVASIPQARMQVYFIDNDEFFKRKATFYSADGQFFNDNDQRAVFFCRGVVETVKKLGWAPDIVHCHGWMASFLPLYIKQFHYDDPLFAESKLVMSVYDHKNEKLPDTITDTLSFDGVADEEVQTYQNVSINDLYENAFRHVDGIILNQSSQIAPKLKEMANNHVTNLLELDGEEDYVDRVRSFYELVAEEEPVV